MTNPILKKLSKPGLSNREIADLLEKHIGHGENEAHCREACEALRRIKDQEISETARTLLAIIGSSEGDCEKARSAIALIRGHGDA